jgi:hypothetical protein
MTDTASHLAPVAAAAIKPLTKQAWPNGPVRVLDAVLRFARVQGTQASTWRGLAMIISACGIYLKPEMVAAISAVGMAISGLIGVLLPDQADLGRPSGVPPSTPEP